MYQLREIKLQNKNQEKSILAIDFDDPAMEIVSEFLMADVTLLNTVILDEMDLVLNESQTKIETSGNRCGVIIGKEYTEIYDLFEGIDDANPLDSYIIKTTLLRELIVIWLHELALFKKERRT